jgi:hypothetical protein
MAKIHEEIIVIKFSKLTKDNEDAESVATREFVESLQAVAEELVGSGTIVEVERVN